MASSDATYKPLRVRIGGRSSHAQLFARPHVSRADDQQFPARRTLFLLGVPHRASSEALSAAFATAGEVTAVHLAEVAGNTRSAHVVFAEPAALKKALSGKRALTLELGAPVASSASAGGPVSRAALQQDVDGFLQRFEAGEAERRAAEDAAHNAMDADGFVVVARKHRGRSTSTDAASGATAKVASAGAGGDGPPRKKKKKSGELTDFYHFQQHEKKREHLVKLRESFEADKARIAKMRADRKFKPQGYHVQL